MVWHADAFNDDFKFKIEYMNTRSLIIAATIGFGCLCIACKKLLEVNVPETKIERNRVFDNDGYANSAVVGMYINTYSSSGNFISGYGSLPWLLAFAGDEFHNLPQTDWSIVQFEDNEIQADNPYISGAWASLYALIYQANSILEGLDKSVAVTTVKKAQFQGEALFMRAFAYFYLVNTFGNVPLALTTNYKLNSKLSRASESEVYRQIEIDLVSAESLLPEDYLSDERVRPNKSVAKAFLARVYLYRKEWLKAEINASYIINQTNRYNLSTDLNNVFVASSREAIWQLKPSDNINFTREGATFLESPNNILTLAFVNSFTPIDQRKIKWMTKIGNTFLPFKYKAQNISSMEKEYSMIFRLAEQYLIRAEARAQLGHINNANSALSDINIIRKRAGLEDTTATDLSSMMGIIEQEKKLELFTEWAHRWFDLKRWNRASIVLKPLKTKWDSHDVLFPIPQKELNVNKNLAPQNSGY